MSPRVSILSWHPLAQSALISYSSQSATHNLNNTQATFPNTATHLTMDELQDIHANELETPEARDYSASTTSSLASVHPLANDLQESAGK